MSETLFIGVDGAMAVNSATTRQQIEAVKKLECGLEGWDWDRLENEFFQPILEDRKRRMDDGELMENRPLFCAITVDGNRAVRLEFYAGQDDLELRADLRAPELAGQELPRYLDNDPYAYDPVEYLKEFYDLPEHILREIAERMNRDQKAGEPRRSHHQEE